MNKTLVKCPQCGKEYSKMGMGTHIWRNHGQGQSFTPNEVYKNGDRVAWNKGLTEQNDARVKGNIQSLRKGFKQGRIVPGMLGKHLSEQSRQKIKKSMFGNNKGGKCKWYPFVKSTGQIVKVQGTYQLRFARVLQLLDPDWIKIGVGDILHKLKWVDSWNIQHYYTPDFYSPLYDKYYEVKGHWWGNDQYKMSQIVNANKNKTIEMVFSRELQQYQNKYSLGKINISDYIKQKTTARSAQQYRKDRINQRTNAQKDNISLILDSNIDFSKRGWSRLISELIGVKREHVSDWCKRFIPQYYQKVIKGARV